MKCIDPWLTKNKRTCPVCKRKVIPGDPDESDSESDSDEDAAPSENTPLLGGGATATRRSENTFNNSGEYVYFSIICNTCFIMSIDQNFIRSIMRCNIFGSQFYIFHNKYV